MNGISPQCSAAQHGSCPGYYRTTHPCHCACHRTRKPDEARRTTPGKAVAA